MSLTINPKAKASSHKIYLDGPGGMRVPARQIHLTDSTSFQVYDTSGPHSDPGLVVDVRYGLAPLRDGCSARTCAWWRRLRSALR